MTLLSAFWIALWIVGISVVVMTTSIVVTKATRVLLDRRTARLVTEVRPIVLAAIDEGGYTPVLNDKRTRIAETIAISLLPKLRGADRDALTHMLEANGVIDHAVGGLNSRSAARRQRSAELLGNAGVRSAERALARRLDDRDVDVRITAARALGRIGDPRSVEDLFRVLAARRIPANTASMAVLRIGSAGSPGILAAIESPVPLVRSTAVELAGSLGVLEARAAIELLLDDDAMMVRTSAARALGRLSMPSSTAPMIDRLSRALEQPIDRLDDDFLVALVEALGRIGHRSSIPVLESCLMRRHRLSFATANALSGMGVRRSTRSQLERRLAQPHPGDQQADLPGPLSSHA